MLRIPHARRLLLLALLVACVSGRARAPNPSEEAQPLILLRDEAPFNATGFDGPEFVLYPSGLAIYHLRDITVPYPRYAYVRLSALERDALFARTVDKLKAVPPSLEPFPNVSDLSIYTLDLGGSNGPRRIRVVGGLWPKAYWRRAMPAGLLDVYDSLTTFSHPLAKSWAPQRVDVLLWPVPVPQQDLNCDSLRRVGWPRDWPSEIDSLGDSQVIRLGGAELPRLVAFQAKYGNYMCTPVVLAGHLWNFGYRYEFPAESLWPPL